MGGTEPKHPRTAVQPAVRRGGRRLVFIGGLHRSGTSVVQRSLTAHPAATGFHDTGVPEDEGQHLQSVYPAADKYGGQGLFGFSAEAHLTEASGLVTVANRDRLLQEWGRYWAPDAAVAVEKSPPNLIRARFLQALFPGSIFVMVLRHPVAVTLATRKGWRLQISYARLVEHWVNCHSILAADARHISNLHVVRYERFVADPDGELRRILAAVDLDPHPTTEPVRTGINAAYFDRWQRLRNPVLRRDRDRAIRSYEGDVRRFGYSLVDLEMVEEAEPLS